MRFAKTESWRNAKLNRGSDVQKDVGNLLTRARSRRASAELELTRLLVKASDDLVLPEDGTLYDRMHAKIMTAVADEQETAKEKAEDAKWTKRAKDELALTRS